MLGLLLVFAAACVVGMIGFAQILWSMKKLRQRGWALTLGTSIVWAAILAAGVLLVNRFLPAQRSALLAGYAITFLVLLIAQLLQKK